MRGGALLLLIAAAGCRFGVGGASGGGGSGGSAVGGNGAVDAPDGGDVGGGSGGSDGSDGGMSTPPAADACAAASLGDGSYCGSELAGGDAATLYHCAGGKTASSEHCAMGCHVAPPGTPDYCDDGGLYHYPWSCGASYECTQGNGGDICGGGTGDHTGVQEYAWDFGLPRHTVVRAARGGTVTLVANVTSAGQACYDGCTQPFGSTAFNQCCDACINTSNQSTSSTPTGPSPRTGTSTSPPPPRAPPSKPATSSVTRAPAAALRGRICTFRSWEIVRPVTANRWQSRLPETRNRRAGMWKRRITPANRDHRNTRKYLITH